MLFIEAILFILRMIKTYLYLLVKYLISKKNGEKNKEPKMMFTACRPPKKGCQGCSPAKDPLDEDLNQFSNPRKLFKKDIENAGFIKSTLSSQIKKERRSENRKPFELSLRRYKKSSSTNLNSTSSQITFTIDSSEGINTDTSFSTSENFFYNPSRIQISNAICNEIERMNEEVFYIPDNPFKMSKATYTNGYELKVATVFSVEVYQTVRVRPYDSENSQIFSDGFRNLTPSTEESTHDNSVSDESQGFFDNTLEIEAENTESIEEERVREENLRRRIAKSCAIIDDLAESLKADQNPVLDRVFKNLKKNSLFLCTCTHNWELGEDVKALFI